MKVLLFTEMYTPGGIDTFIINLINHWPHEDDSFVIIANHDYPGLDVIEANLTRSSEIIRHNLLLYPNVLSHHLFQKIIKQWLNPVLKYLFLFFNVMSLKTILRQASADMLMVVNGGYPGGDSCRAANIAWGIFMNKPRSIHNYHSLVRKAPWYLAVQEKLVDGLVCKYSSQFVTVSKAAADTMVLRPQVVEKSKVTYIHNGLEMKLSQPVNEKNIRDEIGISADTPLCLMLATCEPKKGHLFLFKAFKIVLQKVPSAHLLICGFAFPYEAQVVESYVRNMKLKENVHLMGFRPDVSHLIDNADVLVVPSQEFESFGYVSVEAMIHKTPIVATNVGGIPEVVVNGEGGYCSEKHDINLFAQHIVQLLTDKALRKKQGERGFQRYQNYFTASKMASKYAELIHHVGEIDP